jgi:integrase
LKYKGRVEVDFNGLTLSLMEDDVEQLTDEQLQAIRKYDKKKRLRNSEKTRRCHLFLLMMFARTVKKPFNKVTEDDITDFLTRKSERTGKELKPNTKNFYIEVLVQFFESIGKKKIVEDLQQTAVDDFIDAKELWTEPEIKKLIETAHHPRDKCLVALLFDLALEKKCIRNLNIGDVEVDPEVYITVEGKKRGKRQKRRLKCITSAPYVIDWYNNHPYKDQPDKPFFISLSYNSFGKRASNLYPYEQLKLLAKRAGFLKEVKDEKTGKTKLEGKSIRPHLIRHSAITNLYRRGYRGVHLQRFAGWTSGQMEQRYVNLADEEVDTEREMALHGSPPKLEQPQPSDLMSHECPRCKHKNPTTSNYCAHCWMPLNRKIVDAEMKILEMLRSKWYQDIIKCAQEQQIPFDQLEPTKLAQIFAQLMEQAKLTDEQRAQRYEKQIESLSH